MYAQILQIVKSLQRRPYDRNNNSSVLGTRKVSATTGLTLTAASREVSTFLSHDASLTTTDEVVNFCLDDGISVEKCEPLTTKISSCHLKLLYVRSIVINYSILLSGLRVQVFLLKK